MRRRLSRIVRKVDNNRLQKQRSALPPRDQLRAEAKILRESGDPKAVAVANAFLAVDEMLAADYADHTVRSGGGEATESLRWPLLPEWKDSPEPPEEPKRTR
jgi:hypothetical protein